MIEDPKRDEIDEFLAGHYPLIFTHSKLTHAVIKWLLLVFFFKAFFDVFSQLILKVEQTSCCAYQKTSRKVFVIIVTPNQSENRKDNSQVIEDV